LSLRQPWAWLVVNGYKDIENRSWRTTHRGPLLIHASLSKEDFTTETISDIRRDYRIDVPTELNIGGIVGIVDVVDCVEDHRSRWFSGDRGWVLANARLLPFRECKGSFSKKSGGRRMTKLRNNDEARMTKCPIRTSSLVLASCFVLRPSGFVISS
jgi:hypothetical protein